MGKNQDRRDALVRAIRALWDLASPELQDAIWIEIEARRLSAGAPCEFVADGLDDPRQLLSGECAEISV